MPSQAFVEVVADTRGVEAQMERELSRIISTVEDSLDPIQVRMELDDSSVNRTLRDIERSLDLSVPEVQVRVTFGDLDRTGLNARIDEAQRNLNDLTVTADLQISELSMITALARAQAFLNARRLTVHADIDIDRNLITRLLTNAGRPAGNAGGAATGAGFIAGMIDELKSPQGIVAVGLTLGPLLIGLAGSIAALGIGGIVAGIAFQGFGDAVAAIISGDQDKIAEAMKGLAPSAQDVASEFGVTLLPVVQDIQDKVQQAFFLPLIGASTDLGNALEKLEPSLILVADAMGKLVAKLIEMLTTKENIALLNQILKDSADIIIRVAPYIGEVLVGALQVLGFILSITIDSFKAFKTVLQSPVDGILFVIEAVRNMGATFLKFVTDLGNYLINGRTHINNFQTTVSEKIASVRTTFANLPGAIRQGLSILGSNLRSIANQAMDQFRGAINNKIGDLLSLIRGIPSRARGALGGLAGTLRGSGQSLMQGFIDGILSKIGSLVSAVKSAVGAARNYFPFSPAKEGPFSGRGYTTYSGAALIDGFVSGIQSGTNRLQAAMNDTLTMGNALTPAAAGQGGSAIGSGLVPQSSFTSNPNITLIIGSEAIEGAVETVVETSNARRDRQLVQGVRR